MTGHGDATSGEDEVTADESNQPGATVAPKVRITGRAWIKVLLAFALATAASLVPMLGDGTGGGPPLSTLVGVGSLVAAFTGAGLYVVVRRDLRLGATAAVCAVGGGVLIVAVKFVLGPFGLYEMNARKPLEALGAPLGTGAGTMLVAGLVGALYITGYGVIYRLASGLMVTGRPVSDLGLKIIAVIVGVLVFGSVFGGGAIAAMVILSFRDTLSYVTVVAASSAGAAVGLLLAIASALTAVVFQDAGKRERVVGEATLMVSVFWLGIAFLALYHVLWVVYILILATLWPLKVVTPK
jgi:hypothetical protein